jgi:hypothetical protein
VAAGSSRLQWRRASVGQCRGGRAVKGGLTRGSAVGERKRVGPKENNTLFYLFEIFQKRLN